MPNIQSRFAAMQSLAAKVLGYRFAVLQYDPSIDGLSVWDW